MRKSRDEVMRGLELKQMQEDLSRCGNTLSRYVDDSLRVELGLPPKAGPSELARKLSTKGCCKWNDSLEAFLVYHCTFHGYDPGPVTLVDKCLVRRCRYLRAEKRSEITVKSLNEALRLKNQSPGIYIEETRSGFRVRKKW